MKLVLIFKSKKEPKTSNEKGTRNVQTQIKNKFGNISPRFDFKNGDLKKMGYSSKK